MPERRRRANERRGAGTPRDKFRNVDLGPLYVPMPMTHANREIDSESHSVSKGSRAHGAYERENRRKTASRLEDKDRIESLIVFARGGITAKELAERTGIAPRTVKRHLQGHKGWHTGLIEEGKVHAEPHPGKATRYFSTRGGSELTPLEAVRLQWARHESDRPEESGCRRCGGDEDLQPIGDETLCVWCRGAKATT